MMIPLRRGEVVQALPAPAGAWSDRTRLGLTVVGTAAFLVIEFWKAGAWPFPALSSYLNVARLATAPDPQATYLSTSYIQPSVFWLLGGRSLEAFVVYCALLTVAFLALLLHVAIGRHPRTGIVVLAFPAAMIPLYWIGMDGVTLLLMLGVALARRRRWAWPLAGLLAWHHFEQGVLGLAILGATLLVARRWDEFRRVAWLFPPLLAGRLALGLYFHWLDIHLTDRFTLAWEHFGESSTAFFRHPAALVWSLFGAGWIFLLARLRQTWPMLLAAALALPVIAAAADETRVGVLILFPALLYWVVLNSDAWESCPHRLVIAVALVYLLAPPVYVWGGYVCGRITPHAIEQLRREPRVSRWTWLDYHRPFASGACGVKQALVDEEIRKNTQPNEVPRTGNGSSPER
jgi:hypothetical protein